MSVPEPTHPEAPPCKNSVPGCCAGEDAAKKQKTPSAPPTDSENPAPTYYHREIF